MKRRTLNRLSFEMIFLPLILAGGAAYGQTFDSGSDGSDGALIYDVTGVVVFDPAAFEPPLDPDGDNVFHFTSITIPAGLRVVLRGSELNWAPVYWLASGPVEIAGTLDLRGANGHPGEAPPDERRPSVPGPGGFPGGIGETNSSMATDGFGPGGGTHGGGVFGGNNAGHATAGGGPSVATYGNVFLLPLIGGSGGGGGGRGSGLVGAGGGAGGGAILIASSASISVPGSINANGGRTGNTSGTSVRGGGVGSGGAIRLLAPVIDGDGTLTALGINSSNGKGRIRVEAFDPAIAAEPSGEYRIVTLAPNVVFLPAGPYPAVRVTSVGGQAIAPDPSGSFSMPDAVINTPDPVSVGIEASNIPVGTVVTLTVYNENEPIQTVDSTPLAGTLATSTATASVTFPPGFSRGWARATWSP